MFKIILGFPTWYVDGKGINNSDTDPENDMRKVIGLYNLEMEV